MEISPQQQQLQWLLLAVATLCQPIGMVLYSDRDPTVTVQARVCVGVENEEKVVFGAPKASWIQRSLL